MPILATLIHKDLCQHTCLVTCGGDSGPTCIVSPLPSLAKQILMSPKLCEIKAGMRLGFLKKQRYSSCLWACMRCLTISGPTPCFGIQVIGRWSVTLQPGTWATERTLESK